MHKIKITAIRKADYKDLQQKYENPIQHTCDLQEGQVFIANGWQRPEGMCESAWESISPFVMTLAHGGENISDIEYRIDLLSYGKIKNEDIKYLLDL